MTELFFFQIKKEPDWSAYELYLPLISPERRTRILRMPSIRMRVLSLVVEILLRQEAGKRLGVKGSEFTFVFSEKGKPALKGYDNFYFNWSHTKDAFVLAVSDAVVGVDLECLPMRRDVKRLADRFFTAQEADAVHAAADTDLVFAKIWTRKEAYSKCTGDGLTMPLDSYNVLTGSAAAQLVTFSFADYMISFCCAKAEYRMMSGVIPASPACIAQVLQCTSCQVC